MTNDITGTFAQASAGHRDVGSASQLAAAFLGAMDGRKPPASLGAAPGQTAEGGPTGMA